MVEFLAEAMVYLILTWAPVACGVIGLIVGAWLFGVLGAVVGVITGIYCGILLWRQSLRRDERTRSGQDARVSLLSRAIGRRRRGWWS